MKGKVKWFSVDRGYGFVYAKDTATDYYFGVRQVVGGDLPDGGELVEFEPVDSSRGPQANNVRIMDAGDAKKVDDRIRCNGCRRLMVPRIVAVEGVVRATVCPYCVEVHYQRRRSWLEHGLIAGAIAGMAGFGFVLADKLFF